MQNYQASFTCLENLLTQLNSVSTYDLIRLHNQLSNTDNNDNFYNQENRIKLFKICINYNLGLATFNGYNPHVKKGELLETAAKYWLAAAGGDVQDLCSTQKAKAIDIFESIKISDNSLNINTSEEILNFKSSYDEVDDLTFYQGLAQTKLGMLYSLDSDFKNPETSFFWHTEAAGNGSVESQGALGVMYLEGIGTSKNERNAIYCLKSAANNNNLYSLGKLCEFYYKKKLYGHCLAYSKIYAIKFYNQSCHQIVKEIRQQSQKVFCSETFSIKGAVLCAFYFARLIEKDIYKKVILENKGNLDNEDLLLSQDASAAHKIYKKCANIDPHLMIDLQEQRLYSKI